MSEWRTVKLEEVCTEITVGHVGSMADKYVEKGVPFLRSLSVEPFRITTEGLKFIEQDFHQQIKKSVLKPGDVVIVRTGKPGVCAVIPEWLQEANCSDLVILRCGPEIRPHFLSYFINSIAANHIYNHLVGAVQQHFNVGSARIIQLLLPSLSEQDRILDILSSLDDKIELNRRMNETLEAMARAIFKDWFVDFGPTRAKQEGRSPYLPEHLWSLFPEAINDETGLPEGWELATLERLAELNPESWTTKKHPELIKYVDLANTKWGEIEKIEIYDWEKAPSRARRVLKSGDTIVGTVRPGNGSYALISSEDLTGSTGFAVLRPRRFSDSIFVWAVATSESNIEHLQHLADGGAYPAVRPEVVIQTEVNLPALTILDAYSEVALPIIEKGNRNRSESRTLAEQRDRLLPKLMSGEIRVKDAEKMMEEVM